MLKRLLPLLLFACGFGHPLSVTAANGGAAVGNTPPPATVQVTEYYNADLRHYFITASPTEAAALAASNWSDVATRRVPTGRPWTRCV